MSTHDPSVIERVKKLLALSGSSEPHEAALALQMAQKLMAQHNLTAEQVEVGEIRSEALRSIATKSRAKRWELRLMNGIAEAFGIGLMFQAGMDFVTDSRMYGSWLFIGPKAESAIARYAAHVLQRQLSKARAAFTKTLTDPWMRRADKTEEVDAYCLGWVGAALSKVEKLVPNPKRAAAIERYIKETSGGTTSVQQRQGGSAEAMRRGMEDGREAELNRGVEGGSERLALPDLTK